MTDEERSKIRADILIETDTSNAFYRDPNAYDNQNHFDEAWDENNRLRKPNLTTTILKIASTFAYLPSENEVYNAFHAFNREDLLLEEGQLIPKWLRIQKKTDKSCTFKIDQVILSQRVRDNYHLMRVDDIWYDGNGQVKESVVKCWIQKSIEPFKYDHVGMQVRSVLSTLQQKCAKTVDTPQPNTIFLQNSLKIVIDPVTGKHTVDLDFTTPTVNRLPMSYDTDNISFPVWQSYLNTLFYEEDIKVLQQYMGYLLIPSVKAQKALWIIGEGENGKSRITQLLSVMFGNSSQPIRIAKICDPEKSFETSVVEKKLVLYDDDATSYKLKDDTEFKKFVSSELPVLVERKGQQPHNIINYGRFVIASNKIPSIPNPSSGWYRRQLWLITKPKEPNRKVDRDLSAKINAEIPGILQWCLAGLQRLVSNDYIFSEVSQLSQKALMQSKIQSSPVSSFLHDERWVSRDKSSECTTDQLKQAYSAWCQENDVDHYGYIDKDLKTECMQIGAVESKHVRSGNSRNSRGYKRIGLTLHALNSIGEVVK